MRICLLSLWAGLLAAGSLGATTIQFEVTNLGTNGTGETVDRFTYSVSGLTLLKSSTAFTALDIQFDFAFFDTLSNPAAGSAFNTLLLQPNVPPGRPGDLILMAAIGDTPVSAPFSVDVALLGSGFPGAQQFFIKQFDENGNLLGTLETGDASPIGQVVPEPATFAFGGISLALGLVWWAVRRLTARAV